MEIKKKLSKPSMSFLDRVGGTSLTLGSANIMAYFQ
mgnify:CR=1 FL=1